MTSSSSKSSRTFSDPSSEDKSILGPRVAELGIEDGVTTKEEPSFTAWERATKGSLANLTRGVAGEVLSIWDALVGVTSFLGVGILARMGEDSPLTTPSAWYSPRQEWAQMEGLEPRQELLCSRSKSRSHGLSHNIYPIKETLNRCASRSRNLLTCRVINIEGFEFNLKEEC